MWTNYFIHYLLYTTLYIHVLPNSSNIDGAIPAGTRFIEIAGRGDPPETWRVIKPSPYGLGTLIQKIEDVIWFNSEVIAQ